MAITTSEVVISFLLREAKKDGIDDFTPLKINKLVFLCHGWTLGYHDRPLIENSNGNIQAWQYGPVVVDAYYKLKHFERFPVTFENFCRHLDETEDHMVKELDSLGKKHSEIYELLGEVYQFHKNYNAADLIIITHREGGPWDECYVHNRKGTIIPDRVIEGFYKAAIRNITGK